MTTWQGPSHKVPCQGVCVRGLWVELEPLLQGQTWEREPRGPGQEASAGKGPGPGLRGSEQVEDEPAGVAR